MIFKIIAALIPKSIKTELSVFKKISVDYGQFRSFKKAMSIDKDGHPFFDILIPQLNI